MNRRLSGFTVQPPIVVGCGCVRRELPLYKAGSWGPGKADDLIRADGRKWVIVRRPKAQTP